MAYLAFNGVELIYFILSFDGMFYKLMHVRMHI